MYNFRCDLDLGIRKAAFREILGACLTWSETLKILCGIDFNHKDQLRYGVNERCIYWIKFKGYNNWKVLDLVTTNITSAEKEKVFEIILHGIETIINERIFTGTVGTMKTNDKVMQGCYLVECLTEP